MTQTSSPSGECRMRRTRAAAASSRRGVNRQLPQRDERHVDLTGAQRRACIVDRCCLDRSVAGRAEGPGWR